MKEDEPMGDDATAKLEARARGELRRLVGATDPAIRARLDAAAARAARVSPRSRSGFWRVALPAGAGIAAAGVVAVVTWGPATAPTEVRSPAADDLALLMNVENFDLLEQMEFYQWLDREPGLLETDAAPGAQRS